MHVNPPSASVQRLDLIETTRMHLPICLLDLGRPITILTWREIRDPRHPKKTRWS